MLKFNYEDRHRYDDIIDLSHHVSKTRPHMPVAGRAAQFAPFAALTGHGAAVEETARLTKERIELDEYCKAELDRRLRKVQEQIRTHPAVSVTYFVPDAKKAGGSYVTMEGCVRKINEYERIMILSGGIIIPIDDIIEIKIPNIMDGF